MSKHYIDIKQIADVKWLKSTRSIRIGIQKGKYIAREVKVNGEIFYEILYSSLEPEIQERIFGRAESNEVIEPVRCGQNDEFCRTPNNPREKLEDEAIKSTALVSVENKVKFISENAR